MASELVVEALRIENESSSDPIDRGAARLASEDAEIERHTDQLLRSAMHEYSERGRRARYFPADLFPDPAWDLLLDLYVSSKRGLTTPTTSAAIAARVPPTTALRWIGVLIEHGLIVRIAGQEDRRRTLLKLTDQAMKAMDRYLLGLPPRGNVRAILGTAAPIPAKFSSPD